MMRADEPLDSFEGLRVGVAGIGVAGFACAEALLDRGAVVNAVDGGDDAGHVAVAARITEESPPTDRLLADAYRLYQQRLRAARWRFPWSQTATTAPSGI